MPVILVIVSTFMTLMAQEMQAYELKELVIPEGQSFEVGGIAFLNSGRMVVSTRRGQVWISKSPFRRDKPTDFSLFC